MIIRPELSNHWLLWEIRRCRERREVSPRLAMWCQQVAERYAKRPYWKSLVCEDMIADATMHLIRGVLKFNPEKSDNPFAFLTTHVHSSFLGYISRERKEQKVRDNFEGWF